MAWCRWLIWPLLAAWLWAGAAGAAELKFDAVYGQGEARFSLATGSPGELGLLEALALAFHRQSGASLAWKKAGSGESLRLLKDKAVDMVMVHAPDGEKKAVAEGWAIGRTLLGSNEFFIVGPPADPAGIAQAPNVQEAYRRIAQAQAKFFSRGDNSGTHQKEMSIWKMAGLAPQGAWYVVTKDFMGATLARANAEGGYFMTDSSTWVQEKRALAGLKVLFKGDKYLINTYHALGQPAGATPGAELAARFIAFVASPQGQDIMRSFGQDRYGEGLYNDAAYAQQYDH